MDHTVKASVPLGHEGLDVAHAIVDLDVTEPDHRLVEVDLVDMRMRLVVALEVGVPAVGHAWD